MCPTLHQTMPCKLKRLCPINCQVSRWEAWSMCSKSCGGGHQKRTRMPARQSPCSLQSAALCASSWGGGKACDEYVWEQEQACMAHLPCPVDCVVGQWGVWSACDRTCGSGVTRRSRTAAIAAAHGGKACPALKEERKCNSHKCKWKPQCHHKHVHCRVKTVQLSGSSGAEGRLSHVIEVTHDKGYQHVDANYHCRLHADEATCDCFCDKHPPCCCVCGNMDQHDCLSGSCDGHPSTSGEREHERPRSTGLPQRRQLKPYCFFR